jgi:RNA polymerase sigma factor (sigma-70 family)
MVAARRELLGERAVHEAGEQQPGEEDEVARARPEFVVDEAESLVGEAADAGLSHAARQDNHSTSPALSAFVGLAREKVSETRVEVDYASMEAHSFARSDGGLPLPRSRRLLAPFKDERLVAQLRRGNEAAFEVLYDRHHAAVLSYCRHMLGSRDEAEDALQQAFVSAHADIVSTDKPIRFKAWIFTIARNRCLSILRARREHPTDNIDRISTAGLADQVEHRAELKELVGDMQELPDDQRTALILSELGDLSHAEVAEVIGCEVAKVKSLVFQARSGLIERRQARETPCEEIREQISTLRGGSLRRGPLRRHLKVCPGCSEFREEVRRQRQMVAAVLPVVPTLALKENALAAVGISAASAGGGVLAGGGGAGAVLAAKTGVAKVAVLAAATTGTVGGAVAIDRSVVDDGPRNTGAQSQSAVPGGAGVTGSSEASEMRATEGSQAFTRDADKTTVAGADTPEEGAKDKKRLEQGQGATDRERGHEVAAGRGQGNHHGLAKQQVAHGGSNPHAGPKPKETSPGHQAEKPGQQAEKPGPQNDKPKPHPNPELAPLLPAVPELEPPSGERAPRIERDDKPQDDKPRDDKLRDDQPETDPQL